MCVHCVAAMANMYDPMDAMGHMIETGSHMAGAGEPYYDGMETQGMMGAPGQPATLTPWYDTDL